MAEGTKDIKVGTLIALTVEVDEDWKTVEMPDGAKTPSEAAPVAAEVAGAPVTSAAAEPPPGQYDRLMCERIIMPEIDSF